MSKKNLFQKLNGNTFLIVSTIISLTLIIWLSACQSKTKSVLTPHTRVSRQGLEVEIDQFLALAELRFADLDRQDDFKRIVFDHALIFAQTGTWNPVALLTTFGSILGMGAVADNVRSKVKARKKKSADSE